MTHRERERSVPNKRNKQYEVTTTIEMLGSCCGSVGRVVTADARGLRFKSSHWQTFISDIYLFTVNCIEKTKIKDSREARGQVLHALKVQL